uniref:Uncharacterized protein n=1 Tax=Anguilla anguilla TaxID=7936 RepID=A0A0E9RTS5_ANGAN
MRKTQACLWTAAAKREIQTGDVSVSRSQPGPLQISFLNT